MGGTASKFFKGGRPGLYERQIIKPIMALLQRSWPEKMVFVGGPRQVGKTTLALSLLGREATEQHPAYLNWDNSLHAEQIRRLQLPPKQPVVIFDEIHKYIHWRNLIKGIFDTQKSKHKLVVTGSARLDYYRRGGDSLANRYRYFRLHPLSITEVSAQPQVKDLQNLLQYSGFPEPFLQKDMNEHSLWRRNRITRVVQDDIRDLSMVRDVSLIEHLIQLLPAAVGSVLSVKNLKDDLQVDHKTVMRYLQILDSLYICFRITPYAPSKARLVQKANKLYLWDWSGISNEGARFENLVAAHLLKYCHFIEDTQGHVMQLHYLRDTRGHEVDFVVTRNHRPMFGLEVKMGHKATSKSVHYFSKHIAVPQWYQVHMRDDYYERGNITVLPFIKFYQMLEKSL